MTSIHIQDGTRTLSVSWSDTAELKAYAKLQTGTWNWSQTHPDDFAKRLQELVQRGWESRTPFFRLDENPKHIIDVGSGIGTMSLLLAQRLPDAEFFLVDKSGYNPTGKYISKEDPYGHGFYNTWEVFKDALLSTGIDPRRFTILHPEDQWPDEVDFVMSNYSWCWHYPLNAYWHRTLNSLRLGGTLALDVMNTDVPVAEVISSVFESQPEGFLRYPPENIPWTHEFKLVDRSHGGFYSWKRKQ